ncbi:MAG: hypothetical protein E6Q97_36905 [Desulfurellales bacterium]|nr:MAG: hypothetical protein E6Q97_36905 [Desulfurellales bacterium]
MRHSKMHEDVYSTFCRLEIGDYVEVVFVPITEFVWVREPEGYVRGIYDAHDNNLGSFEAGAIVEGRSHIYSVVGVDDGVVQLNDGFTVFDQDGSRIEEESSIAVTAAHIASICVVGRPIDVLIEGDETTTDTTFKMCPDGRALVRRGNEVLSRLSRSEVIEIRNVIDRYVSHTE